MRGNALGLESCPGHRFFESVLLNQPVPSLRTKYVGYLTGKAVFASCLNHWALCFVGLLSEHLLNAYYAQRMMKREDVAR